MRTAPLAPALALLVLLPASGVSAAPKAKPGVVLVEADGRDEELSAFVARFESELADGGKVLFSDARLSGASLGSLGADPGGDTARTFRTEWPGNTWLAISLSPCRVEVSRMRYNETTPEGYRVDRVIENVRVDCRAALRLVDAATGRGAKPLEVVSLPDGTGVAALAVAADGTVWYTAQFSGGVGRVSPSGEVRLLGFPSRGTQPLGLAL
jgi:hypothetical protein